MEQLKEIKAKSTVGIQSDSQIDETLFRFCVHFPAYTLQKAAKLPYHHVLGLLAMKRKEKAAEYMELLNIQAAGKAKKPGQAIKKLQKQYQEVVNA